MMEMEAYPLMKDMLMIEDAKLVVPVIKAILRATIKTTRRNQASTVLLLSYVPMQGSGSMVSSW